MRTWATKEQSYANLLVDELHPKFGAKVERYVTPQGESLYAISNSVGQYITTFDGLLFFDHWLNNDFFSNTTA